MKRLLAALLIFLMLSPGLPAQNAQSQSGQGNYTFHSTSELVLVNVVVRDKSGTPVKGLTRDDFTVLEDGKAQKLASFDYQDIPTGIAKASEAGPSQATVLTAKRNPGEAPPPPPAETLRDRRLMVLFFDFTGMEPEEVDRSATAAQKFVDEQMSPADLVSVVSLSTRMQVDQDFTSDKMLLKKALAKYSLGEGSGYANGLTGDTEDTADSSNPFTPDETEYNVFNTDRKLEALASLAQSMSKIEQKKSIIYFSNGVQQTGSENQAELRAAVNEAIKSNVSIYTVDIRGLQALPPGGEARNASLRGTSIYSGQSGDAADAGGRHRRSRVPRQQRFRPRLQSGAERHVAVLPARISQRQPAARRALSPHLGQAEESGLQAGVPLGILRAARLPALHARRSRAAVDGRTGGRFFRHRRQHVHGRGLFSHRRRALLRAGVGGDPGFGNSVHQRSREG
jgi:VWFA-related protein